jgi:hypothetical protein
MFYKCKKARFGLNLAGFLKQSRCQRANLDSAHPAAAAPGLQDRPFTDVPHGFERTIHIEIRAPAIKVRSKPDALCHVNRQQSVSRW